MHLRKLSVLACAIGTAFCSIAFAQTSTPTSPSTHPSTGTGATPGGLPPSGGTTPSTGMGSTTTTPGAGGPNSNGPTPSSPSTPGASGSTLGRSVTGQLLDFGAIDADGDGFISRAEASRAGVAGQFTTLDKNNDGRLDRSEFSHYRSDGTRAPDLRSGASPSTGTGPVR